MEERLEVSKPLPVSKHVRVYFEVIRTLAAISQVSINSLIALKVFHII